MSRMTPEISNDQRKAIEEGDGLPVYVVDSSRNQTYVLLNVSDFEKVRSLLAPTHSAEQWTEEANERRIELIDKRVSGSLTATESVELDRLQQRAEMHFDDIAPPPMDGLVELHKQLVEHDE